MTALSRMFFGQLFFRQVFFAVLAIALLGSDALAATYAIDPAHTKVGFQVRHLGISNVWGKFNGFEGKFTFDEQDIAASSAEASIKAASIDTENKKRDDHLRSPDFLNAEKHELITFKSTKITDVDGRKFKVHGNLTINGVARPVVLDTEFLGAVKDPWGNERAGFTATTEINRKDFGLTWNKLLETGGLVVGETVKILLEVEGIKE